MIKLALKNNSWVQLSNWEALNPNWSFTLDVLNHHKKIVQESYGQNTHLMFLCGGDIVESFGVPNLWKDEHVNYFLSFLLEKFKFMN